MPATVFPTGTVHYDPARCWNGYTLFGSDLHAKNNCNGAVLIDMNGNVVNRWKGLDGFPNKMLPGGSIFGASGIRDRKYGYQDMVDLLQVDWDGNVEWKFDRHERIKDPRHKPQWMARQHHDYQREGNPVGYYVPGMEAFQDKGKTLILCHKTLTEPKISSHLLVDDAILEVGWEGKITWEWVCSQHFEEFGFDEAAKNAIARNPNRPFFPGMGPDHGDWMHMNSISLLGPNRWWDAGDERFNPENIIADGRQTNITFIIERKTGNIVWKLGPDYTTPETKRLGQIIGQHHAHMIPVGLPGAGNILLFDNGGSAGYGIPNPGSPTGVNNALRDRSRVIEFDPLTLEVVWSYPKMGPGPGGNLYSSFVCSAQRLVNGNTMITEGGSGRIIEVTPEGDTVWEYLSPFTGGMMKTNMMYRAYRVPYEWVPQVEKPEELAVQRPNNNKFRVPGSPKAKPGKITKVRL